MKKKYSFQNWVNGDVLLDTVTNTNINGEQIIASISDFDSISKTKIISEQRKIFNKHVELKTASLIENFNKKINEEGVLIELFISNQQQYIKRILSFNLAYDKNIDCFINEEGIPLFDWVFYQNMKNYFKLYKVGTQKYNFENIPYSKICTIKEPLLLPEVYYESMLNLLKYVNKLSKEFSKQILKSSSNKKLLGDKTESRKSKEEKLALEIRKIHETNWVKILKNDNVLLFFCYCVINFNPKSENKRHDVRKYTAIYYFLTDQINSKNKVPHKDYISFVSSPPISANMNNVERLQRFESKILFDNLDVIWDKFKS